MTNTAEKDTLKSELMQNIKDWKNVCASKYKQPDTFVSLLKSFERNGLSVNEQKTKLDELLAVVKLGCGKGYLPYILDSLFNFRNEPARTIVYCSEAIEYFINVVRGEIDAVDDPRLRLHYYSTMISRLNVHTYGLEYKNEHAASKIVEGWSDYLADVCYQLMKTIQ